MVAGFHQNRRDNSTSDSDLESKFDLYQKMVEFHQNWSKLDGFCRFQRRF